MKCSLLHYECSNFWEDSESVGRATWIVSCANVSFAHFAFYFQYVQQLRFVEM